jgi:WD40 repeat protein
MQHGRRPSARRAPGALHPSPRISPRAPPRLLLLPSPPPTHPHPHPDPTRPDPNRSNDKTAILWDLSELCAAAVLRSAAPVLSLAFSPGGEQLACGSKEGLVRLHDVHCAIRQAAEAASEQGAAGGGREGEAHAPVSAGRARDEPQLALPPPGAPGAAGGSAPGSPRLGAAWSPRQPRPLSPLAAVGSPPRPPPHLHSSNLGRTSNPHSASAAAAAAAAAGAPAGAPPLHVPLQQALTPAALAAAAIAGTHPASAFAPGASTGRPSFLSRTSSHMGASTVSSHHTQRPHPDTQAHVTVLPDAHGGFKVRCCAFSPDAKQLLSGGADGSLVIWDLSGAAPAVAATIQEHAKAVRCCAFVPFGDADQLVACAEDGVVLVQVGLGARVWGGLGGRVKGAGGPPPLGGVACRWAAGEPCRACLVPARGVRAPRGCSLGKGQPLGVAVGSGSGKWQWEVAVGSGRGCLLLCAPRPPGAGSCCARHAVREEVVAGAAVLSAPAPRPAPAGWPPAPWRAPLAARCHRRPAQ